MNLREFQDRFAHALLGAEPGAGGFALMREPVAAQPAFAVYRNTVMKGCIDALQANYPAVARLVGDDWFRAAAAIFARANLPRDARLLDYGAGFPAFLEAFEPARELPYLPGVAHLDRLWTEAHVARDEDPVPAAAVARLHPQVLARTVLQPHASARWASFDVHPILTIWRRNRDPDRYAEADIDWRGEGALLVRPCGAVESVAIDTAGVAFLDECAAGATLAHAADAALTANPDADLAALMARLLEAGAFGRMDLLDEEPKERR
jgi:hypothetical protein